ncbi:MAG TPA: ABC transporter substrate-binding protein [Symbiobacteriaceae bacterium]|nr:ABC transporter substrate-binding protein [Symbiobacteriaceae bacterium]
MKRFWPILALSLCLLLSGCSSAERRAEAAGTAELRLGYMANLTHAQAVLGMADGSLERAAGVRIKPKLFSAGPPAITALLAGEIDVLYVGPSPAVTGYIRSEGQALRVVAGAASGGALFAVRPGVDPNHLDGARLATPGIANTQDVALRYRLAQQGLRPRERGGSVTVTPLPPAETLGLFARGQLDGAWVAEPWGARLEAEAGARIAIDERDLWPDRRFPTTLVVVATPYLKAHPDVVKRLLEAHVQMTDWINQNPDQARERLRDALAKLQGKALPEPVMAAAFARVDFLYDPMRPQVTEQARRAYDLGYLGARPPDLTGLFDLTLLEEVAP